MLQRAVGLDVTERVLVVSVMRIFDVCDDVKETLVVPSVPFSVTADGGRPLQL